MRTNKRPSHARITNQYMLVSDDLQRLTDLFSIFIQIDKRTSKLKEYGKQNK